MEWSEWRNASKGAELMPIEEQEDQDDQLEPVRFVFDLAAPPGMSPEKTTLLMTDPRTGATYGARPGLDLLILMADMKRSGCEEAQIKQALLALLNSPRPSKEEIAARPSPLASHPQFTEIMQRIDAGRDANGVPTQARAAVRDLIRRFSEVLLEHPFSQILPVCMGQLTRELTTKGMTPAAQSRLSALVEDCYQEIKREPQEMKREMRRARRAEVAATRPEHNHAKRRRRRR